MSLSICLITVDPAARVAAILEPLLPHAEEIVIAADSRVDEETLAGYAALADRLFKIEFCQGERHLAWLFAQCSGDWILRLDGDEVPSPAFVRRLSSMLASRNAQQFWIAQAWLYPDADHVLTGAPWSSGFSNRLMRNDGTLRVRGLQHLHADPATPCEYVEEPFYHLDLLISSEQDRRDKVIRYEVSRPHLVAEGGGRINEAFYLPELRDSLELQSVPDEDRAAIARALDGSTIPPSTVPVETCRWFRSRKWTACGRDAPSGPTLIARESSRASLPCRWHPPSNDTSSSGSGTKEASAGPPVWTRARRSGSPIAG